LFRIRDFFFVSIDSIVVMLFAFLADTKTATGLENARCTGHLSVLHRGKIKVALCVLGQIRAR